MKFFSLLPALLFALTSYAQPGYKLECIANTDHVKAGAYHYRLAIAQVDYDYVVKNLEKRLERGTKQEVVNRGNGFMIMEKVAYKSYWTDSLVIYAEVKSEKDSVNCYFNFMAEDSSRVSLSSHPVLDKKVSRYMKEFGLDMFEYAVGLENKREQKKYKSIEKELKSAQHDELKIEQKISNEKLANEDTKDEIAMNEGDRSTKIAAIQTQKEVVATTNGEQKAVEKQTLKTLKSDLKHLRKQNKKLHNNILKRLGKIQDLEMEKERNQQLQVSIKERLTAQGEVLNTVRTKEFSIKDARQSMD